MLRPFFTQQKSTTEVMLFCSHTTEILAVVQAAMKDIFSSCSYIYNICYAIFCQIMQAPLYVIVPHLQTVKVFILKSVEHSDFVNYTYLEK